MSPALLQSACKLRLKGISFRQMSRILHVPRSTLHYHVSKTMSEAQVKRGTIAIIEEHLRSPRLTARQRGEIRLWMASNRDRIMQVDESYGVELLTIADENRATRRECGSKRDFRQNLTRSICDGGLPFQATIARAPHDQALDYQGVRHAT